MAKETFVRTKPHVNVGTIGHIDHGGGDAVEPMQECMGICSRVQGINGGVDGSTSMRRPGDHWVQE